MIPTEAILKLIELEAKATPGEWQSDQCGDFWTRAETEILADGTEAYRTLGSSRYAPNDPNIEFLVSLRNLAKPLLEELLKLREEQKDARECIGFYAAKGNYHDGGTCSNNVEEDYGKIARSHLAKYVRNEF